MIIVLLYFNSKQKAQAGFAEHWETEDEAIPPRYLQPVFLFSNKEKN